MTSCDSERFTFQDFLFLFKFVNNIAFYERKRKKKTEFHEGSANDPSFFWDT